MSGFFQLSLSIETALKDCHEQKWGQGCYCSQKKLKSYVTQIGTLFRNYASSRWLFGTRLYPSMKKNANMSYDIPLLT